MGVSVEFRDHDVVTKRSNESLRQWVVNLLHFVAQQQISVDYEDSEELLENKKVLLYVQNMCINRFNKFFNWLNNKNERNQNV